MCASAEPVQVSIGPQTDDVWVYTFGQGAFASVAPTFAGVFADNDPDRLGCFFLTFDVSEVLDPDSRPARVKSLTLRLSMLNSSTFDESDGVIYDPTYDPVESFIQPELDEDPGRPIELYAAGYQNGFTLESWRQAGFPVSGPEGYNAVPLDFPPDAPSGRDVSFSVSEQFDTRPIAIGTTEDLLTAPDSTQRVLDLARWSFTAQVEQGGLQNYLTQSLEDGSLALIVSSLQLAGFDGMGGTEIYPRFATLETFAPVEDATIDLLLEISPTEDVNTDFTVDLEDLYAWEQGVGLRDINADGAVDTADRHLLLDALRSHEAADMLP